MTTDPESKRKKSKSGMGPKGNERINPTTLFSLHRLHDLPILPNLPDLHNLAM
jgi:hypothetical protein